jgi:hypothetical protein
MELLNRLGFKLLVPQPPIGETIMENTVQTLPQEVAVSQPLPMPQEVAEATDAKDVTEATVIVKVKRQRKALPPMSNEDLRKIFEAREAGQSWAAIPLPEGVPIHKYVKAKAIRQVIHTNFKGLCLGQKVPVPVPVPVPVQDVVENKEMCAKCKENVAEFFAYRNNSNQMLGTPLCQSCAGDIDDSGLYHVVSIDYFKKKA